MSAPNPSSQDGRDKLETMKRELLDLQRRQKEIRDYITRLSRDKVALEQLNTSARKAQEARSVGHTGKTVDEQIREEHVKLADITGQITGIRYSIASLFPAS